MYETMKYTHLHTRLLYAFISIDEIVIVCESQSHINQEYSFLIRYRISISVQVKIQV